MVSIKIKQLVDAAMKWPIYIFLEMFFILRFLGKYKFYKIIMKLDSTRNYNENSNPFIK